MSLRTTSHITGRGAGCYGAFIHSFVRSLARSLVRSFVHSFVYFLIHSFVCQFIESFVHTFNGLFIHFYDLVQFLPTFSLRRFLNCIFLLLLLHYLIDLPCIN